MNDVTVLMSVSVIGHFCYQLVLEGFRSLLADGHDWDSLRDLTNELCHDLIGEAYPNTPTDVICPVSLENYAPHVSMSSVKCIQTPQLT